MIRFSKGGKEKDDTLSYMLICFCSFFIDFVGGGEAFKDTYFSILYPVVNRKCIISVQYSGLMI